MSKFFLVAQSSYLSKKDNQTKILTLLIDEKGNPIVSTTIPTLDAKVLPKLPEVKVTVEAGSAFEGRISSKITGVELMNVPK